jgi:hypothetical protein
MFIHDDFPIGALIDSMSESFHWRMTWATWDLPREDRTGLNDLVYVYCAL